MVTEIRIYCEGDPGLREGFHVFFAELREKGMTVRCNVKCFPRGANALKDFLDACGKYPHAWCALLIDSEGPYTDDLFERRVGVKTASPDSTFWMVQLMESWFLADAEGLKSFYGREFQESALRKNPRVEEIPKPDVIDCLDRATGNCRVGKYGRNKVDHANQLLRRIDPKRVRKAAPNCNRLFQAVLNKLAVARLKQV
jgi:uncharacterized protein DUF4276